MSPVKEVWFFNTIQNYNMGLSHYRKYFNVGQEQKMVGESTPTYFHKGIFYNKNRGPLFVDNDSPAKRIKENLGDIKLIITLRDPVSRLQSMYWKNRKQGKKGFDKPLKEIIKGSRDPCENPGGIVYANKYKIHLSEVLSLFPKENVYLTIFEEWVSDFENCLKNMFDFLGLRQLDMGWGAGEIYNSNRLYSFNKTNPRIIKRASSSGGSFMSERAIEKVVSRGYGIAAEEEISLREIFKEDIEFVEYVLGREINSWRKNV